MRGVKKQGEGANGEMVILIGFFPGSAVLEKNSPYFSMNVSV